MRCGAAGVQLVLGLSSDAAFTACGICCAGCGIRRCCVSGHLPAGYGTISSLRAHRVQGFPEGLEALEARAENVLQASRVCIRLVGHATYWCRSLHAPWRRVLPTAQTAVHLLGLHRSAWRRDTRGSASWWCVTAASCLSLTCAAHLPAWLGGMGWAEGVPNMVCASCKAGFDSHSTRENSLSRLRLPTLPGAGVLRGSTTARGT